MAEIKIGGRLHSVAVDQTVANSDEIYDKVEQKKQEDINAELRQGIADAGNVDDVIVNGVPVVQNKVANITVPTKVSDLPNDVGFAKTTEVAETINGIASDLQNQINTKQATITATVSPTVTEDGGEPSASMSFQDGQLGFSFQNLKGERGNGIASVTEQTSSEDGGINTHTIHYTDPNVPDSVIHTRNGSQGRPGADFQPIEDVSGLSIAHSLGDDETKVMSQKGATDALKVGADDITFDLSQFEEVNAWISSQGKWSTSHKGIFVPVVGGKKYRIVANALNFSTYAFVVSNVVGTDGSEVTTFAGTATAVTTLNAGEADEITAPLDASYLFVGKSSSGTDRTPQEIVELNKKFLADIWENANFAPTENSDELVKSGGVYQSIINSTEKTTTNEIDLTQYAAIRAIIAGDGRWSTSSSYIYYGKIIPIKSLRQYKITGNKVRTSYYAFLTSNTYSHNANAMFAYLCQRENLSTGSVVIATAPADAKYLWISDMYEKDRSPQKVEEYNSVQVLSAIDAYERLPKKLDLDEITSYHIGPNGDGIWKSESWYGKFVALDGERKVILKGGANSSYYCFLKTEGFVLNGNVDYATGYSGNGRGLKAGREVIVDVPSDAKCLYFFTSFDNNGTSCEPEKVVLINELVGRDELSFLSQNETMPTFIEIKGDTGVIYTTENFIMRYFIENETTYLQFSQDLGQTWVTVENTFDERITHVHYFLDGTFLMCTPSQAFWTKDFQTWNESVVYDYDGSIFQPVEGETRFFAQRGRYRTIIDDQEWHLFGDYILTTKKPRLWYTNDNGRTIRAAFAFGLSDIDGTVLPARHVHNFEYNPYDKHFYVFTGDAANECHIMKGTYEGGVWTWERIVTGAIWKLVYPEFFPGYFCAITDYTDNSLAEKKGVIKIPTQNISQDNITYLFKATSQIMGSSALTNYICDKNGWRVVLTDYLGGNKIMIAKNNFNFQWVTNTQGLRIGSFTGPNANGDVYSSYRPVGASVASEDILTVLATKFNFTEAMREAGAKDFFNYRITDF